MTVAICGGGTGGHIYPLLALREELESRDVETVLYLSEKGQFAASELDCRVKLFDLEGYSRSLSPRNLRAAGKLARALRGARREMKCSRPAVAVGFGGYASLPPMVAALWLGIPTLIHEQNVVPGVANRLLALLADRTAVSFMESAAHLGRRSRITLTGNPLRAEFSVSVEKAAAYGHFDLEPGRQTIVVLGGSQGAAALNQAVRDALPLFDARDDLQLVHAVGKDKYDDFASGLVKPSGGFLYRPFPFIERMDLLYAVADLAVCRAGATTLAELQASGVPSILVPYPFATGGHQEKNALWMERAGAARMVKQEELDGESLHSLVDGLLGDRAALEAIAKRALQVARPDAAARLADLAVEMAAGRTRS